MMNIREIKRICGVRGCKNKVSYALSRKHEMGNSVIICEDCLKESLAAVQQLNGAGNNKKAKSKKGSAVTQTAADDVIKKGDIKNGQQDGKQNKPDEHGGAASKTRQHNKGA